jgi:hypothetical protein
MALQTCSNIQIKKQMRSLKFISVFQNLRSLFLLQFYNMASSYPSPSRPSRGTVTAARSEGNSLTANESISEHSTRVTPSQRRPTHGPSPAASHGQSVTVTVTRAAGGPGPAASGPALSQADLRVREPSPTGLGRTGREALALSTITGSRSRAESDSESPAAARRTGGHPSVTVRLGRRGPGRAAGGPAVTVAQPH